MKLNRTIILLMLAQFVGMTILMMLTCGFGYQHYRKTECENCHVKPAFLSFVFLAVHHSIPQHVCKEMDRLDLINDPDNLITLCDSYICRTNYCHWREGHGAISWSYDNSKYTNAKYNKNKWMNMKE